MSQIGETGVPAELTAVTEFQNDTRGNWERFCKELLAERERVCAELEEVNKERDLYRRALQTKLQYQEVDFTKEEVFAQRGKRPNLHQLIVDLGKELSA